MLFIMDDVKKKKCNRSYSLCVNKLVWIKINKSGKKP